MASGAGADLERRVSFQMVDRWIENGEKGDDPRGPRPCDRACYYSYKAQKWLTREEADAIYGKLDEDTAKFFFGKVDK